MKKDNDQSGKKEVCRMIKDVMKVLKTHGLSLETARQCIAIIASMQACCSGRRFSAISDMLTRYISSELKLVEAEDKPHNITSDMNNKFNTVVNKTYHYDEDQ